MRRYVFLLIAGACLCSAATPAMAQSPAEGIWTEKKPLPTARNEVALAAVGGRLYVIGGGIGGNAVPLVDEYDPATDSWRARAPMPKGLDHLGVAVIGGTVVTVGGFIGSVHRGAVNDVYAGYFPVEAPARIFLCVPCWPGPFDIEIDCVAVVESPRS